MAATNRQVLSRREIFQIMSPAQRLSTELKGPRSGCIDDVYRTKLGQFVQFDMVKQQWVDVFSGLTVVAPISGRGRPRALKF